ncbi:MAG: hypothetical protein K0R83_575 [Caulobacter sp.]|jgi:hypothetical protein|nr:hypothetical protein [Caulobacter sp.]
MAYAATPVAALAPAGPTQEVIEEGKAPPTIDSLGDYGSVLIFTHVPMGAHLLLTAALVAALVHGLVTRPRVGQSILTVTRLLPSVLLAIAAGWVWAHALWRLPVPNYEGFEPLGEPHLMVLGFLAYGSGDALLLKASAPWRAPAGAALGVAGLALLAACGWRVHLFEAQPLSSILLVLLVSLAAAGAMLWAWRRLGGKVFGWLFVAGVIALTFVIGGMTSHSFIRLPGAMLACGLASLGARLLETMGRAGSKGMAGWGPWFATVLFQVTVAIVALGAPTF